MDLFEATPGEDAPLAFRMRPLTLDEYIGQQALVGPDKPLRRMAESGVVRYEQSAGAVKLEHAQVTERDLDNPDMTVHDAMTQAMKGN